MAVSRSIVNPVCRFICRRQERQALTVNNLNPILYILYYFFKWFIDFATWLFYRKITVTGKRHDRSENPCIIVSNHPSTLLDPLNVAVKVNAEIFFLANASLFRNPFFGWLLRKLYCIPIERYQDTGGKPLDNAASFEQAENHLIGSGCIYVAPEGSSFVERRLRKLKTGTARIALAAMQRSDWSAKLRILPVGLNYSDPTRFRSDLLTIFGEYIPVARFREDYEADPVNAVYCLNEAISEQFAKLIIDCEDGPQDELLRRLETMLQNKEPLPPVEAFERSYTLLGRLRQWKTNDLAAYEAFAKSVFAYFEKTKSLKISDLQVAQAEVTSFYTQGKEISASRLLEKGVISAATLLALAASFPLFLAGWLSHVLPCFFTKKITDALNADYHWVPTYKFATGVVMYPLFIGLQVWGMGKLAVFFDMPGWVKWAYLAAIIPLGLLTEAWLARGKRWRQNQRATVLRSKEKNLWEGLLNTRQHILDNLGSI
jgi:glycerol-3-phosphate O-acyltransferase / dihydroxyacetone phosphate acyltransferase